MANYPYDITNKGYYHQLQKSYKVKKDAPPKEHSPTPKKKKQQKNENNSSSSSEETTHIGNDIDFFA